MAFDFILDVRKDLLSAFVDIESQISFQRNSAGKSHYNFFKDKNVFFFLKGLS
jgi:hypothetical protein